MNTTDRSYLPRASILTGISDERLGKLDGLRRAALVRYVHDRSPAALLILRTRTAPMLPLRRVA